MAATRLGGAACGEAQIPRREGQPPERTQGHRRGNEEGLGRGAAAADAAVRRIGHAAARPDDAQNREPSHGELLCSALLEYWKVDTNWNTHAIRALEALAHDGKGNLAQWGAQELLSGGTIALSATSGSKTRQRLTRLADDGTALEDWGKGKNISAKAQAPSSTDGGEHEQFLEPAGAARPLPEVEPG